MTEQGKAELEALTALRWLVAADDAERARALVGRLVGVAEAAIKRCDPEVFSGAAWDLARVNAWSAQRDAEKYHAEARAVRDRLEAENATLRRQQMRLRRGCLALRKALATGDAKGVVRAMREAGRG